MYSGTHGPTSDAPFCHPLSASSSLRIRVVIVLFVAHRVPATLSHRGERRRLRCSRRRTAARSAAFTLVSSFASSRRAVPTRRSRSTVTWSARGFPRSAGIAAPRVGSRAAVVRSRGGRARAALRRSTPGPRSLSIGTERAEGLGASVARRLGCSSRRSIAATATTSHAVRTAPNRATAAATKRPVPARKSSGGEVAARAPVAGRKSTAKAGPRRGWRACRSRSLRHPRRAPKRRATAIGDSVLSPTANIALRAAPDARALATVGPGHARSARSRARMGSRSARGMGA